MERRAAAGGTEGEHLESAARQLAALGRAPPPQAEAPPFPDELGYLWAWYRRLAAGRQAGMAGPAPLAWVDLDAFFRLQRTVPDPWECDALMMLDGAWLQAHQEARPAKPAP